MFDPKDDSRPEVMRSYRIQYTMKEASFMMCTSEDTLMKWIKEYDVPIYKMSGKGSNFILHKDLELLILRGAVMDQRMLDDMTGQCSFHWDRSHDQGYRHNKDGS